MEFIGTIIEVLKCAGAPLCKYVHYHRNLNENMRKLQTSLQELNSQKNDKEAMLKAQLVLGKLPSNEVKNWLENVQSIFRETQDIEQKVNRVKYFSRARLGKLVEEKIQEVKECLEKGRSFTSLVIDAPPSTGLMLPTTTLAGESTKKIVEKIWVDLMGDEVTKIGVWGMGGVGKTTIMRHINKKLQKETNKFNVVIWVTVSQPLDLIKLQKEIASALKGSLPESEDKERRAGTLYSMLIAKQRFVLILDDMWKAFPLEEVGIPEPSKENGCKLVITTRSRDVCRSMGCREVRVEPLSKEEALNLFLEKNGVNISQAPALNEIIKKIVDQCARLPLAIVTVACSMRGVDEIHEWRNALNELGGHVTSLKGVDKDVFGRLEFSYRRIKDEKVQHCFLYCALYPEDYLISKDELIDYWIAEGFLEDVIDVQAKYDRGHTILNRLVNSCLLENATNGCCVRMHDLIRDMALRITSESPLFMVQAGVNLLKFPGEEEWKKNPVRVSLMLNDIEEIPSNMSPHSETLSTLLLQRNWYLKTIPECFFVHMHGLKVLNLSYTRIGVLPNSISELRNLTSLLLRDCRGIQRVPSLAKLLALQYLDLGRTRIKEVPEGVEMLENLIQLNLESEELQKLPSGVLPKLRNLSRLILYWGSETLGETLWEAAILSNRLDTFECKFCNVNDFNIYVKSSHGRQSKNYRLFLVETTCIYLYIYNFFQNIFEEAEVNKAVALVFCNIWEREELPVVLPKDVECLCMDAIPDVTSLSDVLSRKRGVFNIGQFSHLKALSIDRCFGVMVLFSLQSMTALQNLEVLKVTQCNNIKEIVAVDVEKEETNSIRVTLPRLKKLHLEGLEQLKSVCSDNAILVCNSLQEIQVYSCPNLKRLSLSLPLLQNGQPSPLPALKEINIERRLWESLEWDQANAKYVLYRYCRFGS